jgi:phytoene dehydrogenase-like protein
MSRRPEGRGKRAVGVQLVDGRQIMAPIVSSNLNPALLYGKLVAPSALPAPFAKAIKGYKNGSGTFRMNVALSELPDFTCLPGKAVAEHHQCGIVLSPTLDYMDEAYRDAKATGSASARSSRS